MMHLEANGGRGTATETQNGGRAIVASATPDESTMAAIALALELEGQPEASRIAANRNTSPYAQASRVRVMRGG